MNFKQFNPLYKLNSGLMSSDVFKGLPTKRFETHPRHQRFATCTESLRNNLLILEYLLGRIAEHHHITYNTDERQNVDKYKFVKNTIVLEIDLKMFYITIKILLDNLAFFVPFYFETPILNSRKVDRRDEERPWDFRTMKYYFIKKNPTYDSGFAQILSDSTDWAENICDIRNFLVHRFHDISINQDFWTHTSYAFLCEFIKKKDFIPDILIHSAKTYYKLVKFLKEFEMYFKAKCEQQFPSFEYFYDGHCTANGLNKRHLFFAALGRLLNNKILIRVHPNRRKTIPILLEKFMREEQIVCKSCDSYNFTIKPTVEQFVLISGKCTCNSELSIPHIIEKKLFPHFLDQGDRNSLWGLVPYTLNGSSRDTRRNLNY